MNQCLELEQVNVSKLLFKYSIPAIIAMLVNALYNVVDRICIGRGVGTLGIAGVTFCFPIMNIIVGLTLLVGIGSVTLISINLGKKNIAESELILNNSLVLITIISIVFSVICYLNINNILKLFGASSEVFPYAKQYLQIILSGTLFQGIGSGLNHCIRADGNPKRSMAIMLTGAVTNIILTPFFIFVMHLGIRGAAIGTVIAQSLTAILVLCYFTRGNSKLKLNIHNCNLNINRSIKTIVIGLAPFLSQLAASVVTIVLNKWLGMYQGDIAVSAMGIVTTTSMLLLMPIYGINQGLQPILGYNYGAAKANRVKQVVKLASAWASVITTLGYILIFICSKSIMLLFSKNDPQLVVVGTKMFKLFLLGMPLLGLQFVGSSCFLAMGKPKQSLLLSLLRQVLLLMPLIIILAHFYKFKGILLAGPIADTIAFIITALFVYKEFKNLSFNKDIKIAS